MHLLTVADMPTDKLPELFLRAEQLRSRRGTSLMNKVVACLFFEPSTRTRLSFEASVYRLGGNVISAHNSESLSVSKGETLADTVQTVAAYVDLMVIRASDHYQKWFDGNDVRVPIINAGDGGNNHPTQALLDAYTIWRYSDKSSPLPSRAVVGVAGDVAKSRTIRSFIQLLATNDNRFVVYDTTGRDSKLDFSVPPSTTSFEPTVKYVRTAEEFEYQFPSLNYLYLNRIQRERHSETVSNHFQLTKAHLQKSQMIVLNPGPRREELPDEICHHPQVKMWEQVENGLYLRMALLDVMGSR